jgi:hypothetical protein
MKKIIFTLFAILLAINITSAAGIASPYWSDNPLKMYYGDTKLVDLNLQNMVGNESITVKVEIKQGGDIATLEKDTYTAKKGTSDTIIPLIIKVPEDYSKQSQTIEINTKTITQDQGGMVTLGTGWTTTFTVLLSEKPKSSEISGSSTGTIIIFILLILALIIILYFIFKRKK